VDILKKEIQNLKIQAESYTTEIEILKQKKKKLKKEIKTCKMMKNSFIESTQPSLEKLNKYFEKEFEDITNLKKKWGKIKKQFLKLDDLHELFKQVVITLP
jgi:predicted RNase H-like nuclease (RuvC/YqgF family)